MKTLAGRLIQSQHSRFLSFFFPGTPLFDAYNLNFNQLGPRNMVSDGHKQPTWIPPEARADAQLPRLKIYNSLTRSKDDFVPVDPIGKMVTWYACGPTVYEDAHLGHAKNYVSTDIIRRIVRDYFGFRVKFVTNTTDVNDKIILQARRRHLLARFKQEHAAEDDSVSDAVLAEAKAAFRHYMGKKLPVSALGYEPRDFFRGSGQGI